MEATKSGRKIEKPHPERKEGDRMPVEPLPIEDVLALKDSECYDRLREVHNIIRGDIFKHPPTGAKWPESILLHAVLGYLEGHGPLEIVNELRDENVLPFPAPSIKEDAGSLIKALAAVCEPNMYQKIRYNAVAYQSNTYKLRDISPHRVATILNKLGLERGDLFSDEMSRSGKAGGAITLSDLVRTLELRINRLPWKKIVSRLASEGNVELGRMEIDEAVGLLSVEFVRYFSEKTRTALHNLTHKE